MRRNEAPEVQRRWTERLALGLYSAAQAALLPFILPWLAAHPRLRGGLGQRLGFFETPVDARPVWFHGASAGDVSALIPLAEALQQRCVLTTWTRSGQELADRRAGRLGRCYRAPLDLSGPVRRALRALQPRLLVLECLELWPRLVATCCERRVPVALVNGRLSAASARAYALFPRLFRPAFRSLALVTALTEAHAERFARAGVPAERIVVEGSSKHGGYRALPAPDLRPSRRPRLVLGSIHREEEAILLPHLRELRALCPELETVIAPRYIHRASAVRRRLARHGLPSHLSSSGAALRPGAIEVLDQMGRLSERYRGATLAFVGGSLVPRGGHNLIEPAAIGAPVVFGPNVEHCQSEAAALLRAGAGWQVRDGFEFRRTASGVLQRPGGNPRAGEAAWRVAVQLSGAASRTAARLAALLDRVEP